MKQLEASHLFQKFHTCHCGMHHCNLSLRSSSSISIQGNTKTYHLARLVDGKLGHNVQSALNCLSKLPARFSTGLAPHPISSFIWQEQDTNEFVQSVSETLRLSLKNSTL
jgi:hypothetical protein